MNQVSKIGWEPEADPEFGRRLIPYLLRRHRWLLAGGIIAGGLVFCVASLFAPPSYSTRGTLHITKGTAAANLLRGVSLLGGNAASVLTDEMQIINSREIGLAIIDELGLQVDVYDPQCPDAPLQRIKRRLGAGVEHESREDLYTRLVIKDVQVSPDMLSSKQRWISADQAGNWTSKQKSGAAAEPLQSTDYSFLPQFGPGHRDGDRYLLTIKSDNEAWQDYRGALTVTPAAISSNIISVRFAHPNPLIAKQAVELIIQAYLDFNTQTTYGDLDALLDFIHSETAAVESRLNELMNELSQYREESHVYSEAAQGSTAVQSIANLSSNRTAYEIQLRQIDNVLNMIDERTASEVSATIQAPATSLPIEQELVSRLADLIQQMKKARQTMTEAHPDVVELQSQISTVIGQIKDSLVTAEQNTRLAIGSLSGDISQLQTQLATLPEASGKIALLSGEIEANQQVLVLLSEQEADAKLRRAGTSAEVRLLDPPPMPSRRDRPRIMRDTALGVVAGLLVALLALLVIESMRRGYRSLRELRIGLNLQILSVIPGASARKSWRPAIVDENYARQLINLVCPQGNPVAIIHLGGDTTSFDLCWALTSRLTTGDKPALLIDGDCLQAGLCRALKQPLGSGLCEAGLEPEETAELVVELGESRNLLRPGQGILQAEGLKRVIAESCQMYSRTVISLPSPARWVHSSVWAEVLDEVILSLPQCTASRDDVAVVLDQLLRLGIAVRGVVVTNYSSLRDPLAQNELAHLALPPPGKS